MKETTNQRPYDDHSLIHEIKRLRDDVRDIKAQIERVAPYAKLEDACLAYGREVVGALVGATKVKRELETELAAAEKSLEQAIVMQGLVHAEQMASRRAEYDREISSVLARLAEDAECHNYVRYQRGERYTYGNPSWGDPGRSGPLLPTKAPSRERIAAYHKLEAERNSIMVRAGVAAQYASLIVAHPEYLEILVTPKPAELLTVAS